jgi:iron-sulfur cluster repair protein YtfE (RIC family)
MRGHGGSRARALLRIDPFQPHEYKEPHMATSKKPKSRSLSLAVELLEADHRKVEALFEDYEGDKESGEAAKRPIAERICSELTVHAQVEEEIFYPWLRENLSEEDMELVAEAEVEHATAKDLIAQIEDAASVDEAYDAKVKVLSEYIKHHVKEEEDEIFPKLGGHKEELDELGQQMASRKAELMEVMGISEEGEEPMPAEAMGKKAKGASRTAQRGER